jgi:hypothetical protein
MATPSSKSAIVNLALGHLKEDEIISIDPPDEDSKAARAGAKWFDQARRDTLESHPWKFASRRRSLLADAEEPGFEYTKRYQLPADFIRIVRIGEDWDAPVEDFDIVGDFIECDVESPLKLVYVYNLTDTTKFSPKYVTSLSYKLAAFMAYEITGNAQLVQAMEGQFVGSLTQAASVSGQNRPTRRVQHSRLKAARNFGQRGGDWRRWGNE